jgi:hypothetical protein
LIDDPPLRPSCIKEGKMDDAFLKALQEQRKREIEKLERDLTLMEAQQKEFKAEGFFLKRDEALRDGNNGARNALDFLRAAYKRELPPQPWEQGEKK